MRLIPFTQTFDGKKADPKLPDKLRDELPGVLAWAVEGVIAWNGQGLGTSKAVEAATEKYRSETDVLDRFFEDECTFGPDLQVGKKTLFEAWERWCDAEGIDPGTQTTFTRTVGERGIIRGFGEKKVKGTRLWVGISLDIPPSDDTPAPSQKSCKHIGISPSGGQVSSDLEKLSPESPREGNSGETGSNLPPAPQDEIYPQNRRLWQRRRSGTRYHRLPLHTEGSGPTRHRLRLVRPRDAARPVGADGPGRRLVEGEFSEVGFGSA